VIAAIEVFRVAGSVAVTLHVPGAIPVTSPVALTVATAGLLELHNAESGRVDMSPRFTKADSWSCVVDGTVAGVGDTTTE
jgi:hypothetical protein